MSQEVLHFMYAVDEQAFMNERTISILVFIQIQHQNDNFVKDLLHNVIYNVETNQPD